MKHTIAKKADGLEVEVSQIEGKEEAVLEAFQECQEGRCSCPTEEYTKLESLEVKEEEGNITLRMRAKSGEELDAAEIERCLEHTDRRTDS